jgi:TolA-binding protein
MLSPILSTAIDDGQLTTFLDLTSDHQSVEQQLYEVIQYQQARLQQLELEARKQQLESKARSGQTEQQQQSAMMTGTTEEPTIPSKSEALSSAPAGTDTGPGTRMSTPRQVAISPEAVPVPRATTVPLSLT